MLSSLLQLCSDSRPKDYMYVAKKRKTEKRHDGLSCNWNYKELISFLGGPLSVCKRRGIPHRRTLC